MQHGQGTLVDRNDSDRAYPVLAKLKSFDTQMLTIGNHKGPTGNAQGGQGAIPNFPKIKEILVKQFSGEFWRETGSPKSLLGTIQSIWVAGPL